jgi:hypothetical protein
MRRFGWQIGGVVTALGIVVALGVLAFGCGSASPRPSPSRTVASTPNATATSDPRVAEVQAAARRYIQALDNAMKTGSPQELNSLSVPGSQAQGNAGVPAHIVRDTGKTFVVTALIVEHTAVDLSSTTALVTVDYSTEGYDAKWPSLTPLGVPRTLRHHEVLELDSSQGQWLVASAS